MQPGARLREGLVTGNEFIFVSFLPPCMCYPRAEASSASTSQVWLKVGLMQVFSQ